MTAPRRGLLWNVVDFSHEVDYGHFSLVDDDATVDGPESNAEAPMGSQMITSGLGWLGLQSGGSGHNPTIVLEAWDREPPVEEKTWRGTAELDVTFVSDELRIWGVAAGPSQGPTFVLPPSESHRYRVRIHLDGGTETQSVDDQVIDLADDDGYEDGFWGLEEWLFQFWPAGL